MAFDPVDKLNKLLREEFDSFEVISECERLNIKLESSMDLSHQKYLLQNSLLEEILKVDEQENRQYYENLLESTKKLLNFKLVKVTGYSCSFVGCFFNGRRHRKYIKHMKDVHSSQSLFCCQYKHKCKRNFPTIELLEDHLKQEHIEGDGEHVSGGVDRAHFSCPEICKCVMISCGQKTFNSVKDLVAHMNNYHAEEPRACVFENCTQTFSRNKSNFSRNHFRLKHFKKGLLSLKEENKMVNVISILSDEVMESAANDENENSPEIVPSLEENQSSSSDSDDEDESESDNSFFLMAYADFYLRSKSLTTSV